VASVYHALHGKHGHFTMGSAKVIVSNYRYFSANGILQSAIGTPHLNR
jgi:hypothetical protein